MQDCPSRAFIAKVQRAVDLALDRLPQLVPREPICCADAYKPTYALGEHCAVTVSVGRLPAEPVSVTFQATLVRPSAPHVPLARFEVRILGDRQWRRLVNRFVRDSYATTVQALQVAETMPHQQSRGDS